MTERPFLNALLLSLSLLAPILVSGCGGAARNAEVSAGAKPPAQLVTPSASTGDAGPAAKGASADADAASGPRAEENSLTSLTAALAPEKPAQPAAASRVSASPPQGRDSYSGQVAECWLPLLQRLQKDPKVKPESLRYFSKMPEYSPEPMGVKVKELFTSAFLRKPRKDDGRPKAPPSRIYRNVVTAANVRKCNDFLARNKTAFETVEKKYPVPREILVALMYVETRLGTYVGKENALWSLACMAAADHPERVAGGVSGIPITDKHNDWLQARLTDKSRWAYNELRALLEFCDAQKLDPFSMPGSVYGAIGICQFMPSNLEPYGDDGDGDSVINLFSEPDAIFSAARYLTRHGWTADMGVAGRRGVLKRYNNLNIYANTILALAESVRTGVVQTGPPDMAAAASVPKKS